MSKLKQPHFDNSKSTNWLLTPVIDTIGITHFATFVLCPFQLQEQPNINEELQIQPSIVEIHRGFHS